MAEILKTHILIVTGDAPHLTQYKFAKCNSSQVSEMSDSDSVDSILGLIDEEYYSAASGATSFHYELMKQMKVGTY